ncbi:MAG: SIMPL domain-containing protein [Clostridia bacterium]|nr:SIMPL domain-containing protein [Clostridia bacterium]
MPRTIAVKGEGRITAKPDYIVLTLSAETKNENYAAAVEKAAEEANAVSGAVIGSGFGQDELKTTNWSVRTEYESYRDADGNYRQRFAGYVVNMGFKLSFKIDLERLSRVLEALTASGSTAEMNVRFTMEDPEALRRSVLEAAAEDARRKAEILAEASGVKLAKLLTIEYNWHNNVVQSETVMAADNAVMPRLAKAAFGASVTPDDIVLTDSAGYVWEIE